MQSSIVEQFENLTNILLEEGYDIKKINSDNFNIGQNKIKEGNLYFICNNKNVYAALLIWNNTYWWSLYKNYEFQPFKQALPINNEQKIEESNYIIEMMMNITESTKIKKVFPNIESLSIDEKIKVLKKIGLNSEGYHIR